MEPDLDLVRLNLVPGMTPRAAAVLLAVYERADLAFRAAPEELRTLPDVGGKLAARIADPPTPGRARAEIRRAVRLGIRLTHPKAPGYPERLLEIPDPPIVLYVLGETGAEDEAVAVVGARRLSVYGRVHAEAMGRALSAAGITVVSGLARGVDGIAHRGALDAGGRTVAVLGSGLDRIYPPEHRGLVEDIRSAGAVISEFPLGTSPRAHHFPMRNRIIAGSALATVVVEGRVRSGSLITARLAGEFGRMVFAVPGRVDSELSRGPHALIRDGAILAETPEQVLEDLGYRALSEIERLPPPADPLQREILALLHQTEPRGVDEILEALEAGAPPVLAALLSLELGGWARALPGRRYLRSP
jgi:DNA processing protein